MPTTACSVAPQVQHAALGAGQAAGLGERPEGQDQDGARIAKEWSQVQGGLIVPGDPGQAIGPPHRADHRSLRVARFIHLTPAKPLTEDRVECARVSAGLLGIDPSEEHRETKQIVGRSPKHTEKF